MKGYIKYLFKTNFLQTLVLTILPTMLIAVIIGFSGPYRYEAITGQIGYRSASVFGAIIILTFIISVIVIILRFAKYKNQKQLDLQYSLPISKDKFIISETIFGFIQIFISYFVMFLTGLLIFSLMTKGEYKTGYFLLVFLVSLIYILITYLVYIFIFLRANSVIDGIVFIGSWLLILTLVSNVININLTLTKQDLSPFAFLPYYPIDMINSILIDKANPKPDYDLLLNNSQIIIMSVNSFVYFIFAVGGTLLNKKIMKKDKTELVGQVSESLIGYKVFLPILIALMSWSLFDVKSSENIIYVVIVFIFGFVMTVLYRKQIRIRKVDFLIIIVAMVLGGVLNLIF